MLDIKIHKFGGAVLASKNGFLNMCRLLENSKSGTLVVISALGRTSSTLRKSVLLSAHDNSFEDSLNLLSKIIEEHFELAESVLSDSLFAKYISEANKIFDECKLILKSVAITGEVTDKINDRFVAKGEDLMLQLIDHYFKNDFNVKIVDARSIIRTNSEFTSAKPDYSITESRINNELGKVLRLHRNIIIQGFVASDNNDNTTTMGFESSNLTATIIAKYLDAGELTIWSNVDGIYDTDPNQRPNSVLIPHLNYNSALAAACSGLKMLYPEMIKIAKEKNIKIYFRNGIFDSNSFTLVDSNMDNNPRIIITNDIKLDISELDDYPFLSNMVSNDLMEFIQIKVLNPDKTKIIKSLANNFSCEIDHSDMIIISGYSKSNLQIFLSKLTFDDAKLMQILDIISEN